MQHCHDRLGHVGRQNTYKNVFAKYHWVNMREEAAAYVVKCQRCAQDKPRSGLTLGQGHPLHVPSALFSSVSIDFFSLPKSKSGYTQAVVYVCRLSKYVRLVAGYDTDSAEDQAMRFLKKWCYGGARGSPKEIVSDRDARWTSEFWEEFTDQTGIQMKLTTARHQKANGQAERAVLTTKRIIKAYANAELTDWDVQLSFAEAVMNNTVSPATGFTPNYLTSGREIDLGQQPVLGLRYVPTHR